MKEFLASKKGFVVLVVVLYVVSLVAMLIIGGCVDPVNTGTVGSVISMIVVVIWGIFGWRALSMIQPNIFLIMPIAGWIFYVVIKAILGIIVGIFVTPYQIAKLIHGLIKE